MSLYLHTATIGKPHGIKGAVSVISALDPREDIFMHQLFFDQDGEFKPFEVSAFEVHHQKLICFSPSILDRTTAQQQVGVKLYCERSSFFDITPHQINGALCCGYNIISEDGNAVGILEYVQSIQNIPMGSIKKAAQRLNLPMQIKAIDHDQQTIQLDYNL